MAQRKSEERGHWTRCVGTCVLNEQSRNETQCGEHGEKLKARCGLDGKKMRRDEF